MNWQSWAFGFATGAFSTAWGVVILQLRNALKQGKDQPK